MRYQKSNFPTTLEVCEGERRPQQESKDGGVQHLHLHFKLSHWPVC